MTRTIQNKALRRALDAAGLADVLLVKDNGYFYITSDDANSRVWDLPETSIFVNDFCQMTPEQWRDEILRLFDVTK